MHSTALAMWGCSYRLAPRSRSAACRGRLSRPLVAVSAAEHRGRLVPRSRPAVLPRVAEAASQT